jgi:hypothetical protein
MRRERLQRGPCDPGGSGACEHELPDGVRMQVLGASCVPLRHAPQDRPFFHDLRGPHQARSALTGHVSD